MHFTELFDYKRFMQDVDERREMVGKNHQQFCTAIGLSYDTWRPIRYGYVYASFATILRIADFCGMQLDEYRKNQS